MPTETANYISDLVPTNPLISDNIADGPSHFWLIKKAIQNTFPNIKGAITASQDQLNTLTGLVGSSTSDGLDIKGNLTVEGKALVPSVTDWTQKQAVPASDADARYIQLSASSPQTVEGPMTFAGKTLVPAVDDWSSAEVIPASQADGRYFKISGGELTGVLYTPKWVRSGFGGGWNGARTNTGDYGWTNGLEFGNPANDGNYRGKWTVTDVLNEGSSNSSGVSLTGYDAAGTAYQWYFAWNGKVTTPGGVLAFESDLLSYFSAASNSTNVTLTNLQGVNWTTSATNSYVQVTGDGISLAVPTVAYTSKQVADEVTLREAADTALQNQINGKQPAGNYVQTNNANAKFYCWNVIASSGDTINFPVEFTDVSSIVICLTSLDTSRGAWLTYSDVTTTSFVLHGRYMSHGNLDQMPSTQVSVMVYGW